MIDPTYKTHTSSQNKDENDDNVTREWRCSNERAQKIRKEILNIKISKKPCHHRISSTSSASSSSSMVVSMIESCVSSMMESPSSTPLRAVLADDDPLARDLH